PKSPVCVTYQPELSNSKSPDERENPCSMLKTFSLSTSSELSCPGQSCFAIRKFLRKLIFGPFCMMATSFLCRFFRLYHTNMGYIYMVDLRDTIPPQSGQCKMCSAKLDSVSANCATNRAGHRKPLRICADFIAAIWELS